MSNNNTDLQTVWYNPVNKLGRFTVVVAMGLSFLPFLYVMVVYNAVPPMAAVGLGIFNVSAAFAAAWIVEPLSYFPALGTAGTYMGILAGSIGQMRVPAALVAKNVAGTEENTQEAEIVGTCGIAGSVYMNCICTTLTALAGAFIDSALPEFILAALSAYILPAIFGAVLAMFTTKGKLQITIPVTIIALLLGYMSTVGALPVIVVRFLMPICVIVGIVVARIEYKMGIAK
jgi:hypothetical protein